MPSHIEIEDYLGAHADLEIEGAPDVMGENFIDEDGDDVTEIGVRARRRGGFGPFNFRRFRIPTRIVRKSMNLAPAAPSNPRSTYGVPSEGGALTPLSVGQASAAAPTVTVEPQQLYQPVRCILSAYDTASGADLLHKVRVTEIKVGARTMFRAGGSANGVPGKLFSADYTGANPARWDSIAPGTQAQITVAGLAGATEVCDIALVGRAG